MRNVLAVLFFVGTHGRNDEVDKRCLIDLG